MADDSKTGGWLKTAFKWAVRGLLLSIPLAVAGQMWLDPLFFMPIHDPTNITAQAWVAFINDKFSFVPELTGIVGDGGLLNTAFMKGVLAPYKEKLGILESDQMAQLSEAGEGMSAGSYGDTSVGIDDVMSMIPN